MIEQEMFFALGFVTAGLLALACLPAVWRRAMRLTTRRLRQLVPLSDEEIVAERDQLRAGFAIEQRRLEQKVERSAMARTALLADVGRRDAQALTLEGELTRAEARIDTLAQSLQATQRELHGVWAGAGTAEIALHDLTGLAEQRRWELLAAEEKRHGLEAAIDEGRATVAALGTRILGLESRVKDLDQALGITKAELARTVEAVGRAAAERDAARRTAEALTTQRDALAIERASSPKEAAEVGLIEPVRSASETERLAVEAAQAAAAQRATIDELRTARDNLAAQLAMAGEARRAAADTIAVLRGETAALEAKLSEMRAHPAPTAEDVDTLRGALRQVSEDVLRLTEHSPPAIAASAGGQAAVSV